MLYSFIKPLLFSLDPEKAHNLTLHIASLSPTIGRITGITAEENLSLNVGTVEWKFPVGLAAGLDKNAEALPFFSGQGFGAIECGTVTLWPQAGNPLPRMFRYPDEESLRNAMGFPNKGLAAMLKQLKNYSEPTPLGVNIGKNKDSTPEESIGELSILQEKLSAHADYFVVNVSSPNTPGLRALQETSYLTELFTELNKNRSKDLYLKISPDLERQKILEIVKLCQDFKLTGIIATNTTIIPSRGTGGVSGRLLSEQSRKIRETILKEATQLELIAVGGITSPEDLFDLWKSGGRACQVYTSYVYQGPELLKTFKKSIEELLKKNQIKNLSELLNLSLEEKSKLDWKVR